MPATCYTFYYNLVIYLRFTIISVLGPTSCKACGYSSYDIEELLRHCKECVGVSRINDTFNFICCMCPYHTKRSDHMRKHLSAHLGYKPFQCKFCDYRSGQKDHILRHMNRVHHGQVVACL
uniref:RE1-silencing transcription factor n=1 Tax=Cacopsylla melanoneura TaxID=428564 RepID=A0A8D8YY00_9HEMI